MKMWKCENERIKTFRPRRVTAARAYHNGELSQDSSVWVGNLPLNHGESRDGSVNFKIPNAVTRLGQKGTYW